MPERGHPGTPSPPPMGAPLPQEEASQSLTIIPHYLFQALIRNRAYSSLAPPLGELAPQRLRGHTRHTLSAPTKKPSTGGFLQGFDKQLLDGQEGAFGVARPVVREQPGSLLPGQAGRQG